MSTIAFLRVTSACAAVAAALSLGLTACGSQLSGSSTCTEFMNASSADQARVITQLAAKYKKPGLAAMGREEVPYECAAKPDETLADLFRKEQD